MINGELSAKLHEIAEQTHLAMHTEDGQPEPFRDQVTLLLMQYESDLDPGDVFRAVLAVANRSNPSAIDQMFGN